MKVAYVGHRGGTSSARLRALQGFEEDVRVFDPEPYFARSYTRFWLELHAVSGPLIGRANRDLLALDQEFRPDVFWVDKGYWILPATLAAMRSRGAFLVHHNTDSLLPRHWRARRTYRLMRGGLKYYDVYFTTNLHDHARVAGEGRPRVELTYLGYDHARFDGAPLPEGEAERWAHPVIFIGHHEPRTERCVLALIEAGLPVTVYGLGWQRSRDRDRLRGHVTFRAVGDEEYVSLLKAAKIALGFVSEWNGNETAGRSFEIPACGTFLLAMRTRQHSECYEEGEEAEFFADPEELVRKVRYYLEHDDRRREIARRGRERLLRSDYSWERYMRDDWAKVRDALAARHQTLTATADLEGRSS